jgi:hypothetical protein
MPEIMHNPEKSIEELENEMYLALLAEIPDLPPYVARGLARTAAQNLRQLRAANQRTGTTPRKLPKLTKSTGGQE